MLDQKTVRVFGKTLRSKGVGFWRWRADDRRYELQLLAMKKTSGEYLVEVYLNRVKLSSYSAMDATIAKRAAVRDAENWVWQAASFTQVALKPRSR